jgi:uncharacterized protein with HEPN domain
MRCTALSAATLFLKRSMLDRAILHLTLIVESVDTIRSHIAGMDRDTFLADRLRRDAVAMNFQVIG